MLKFLSFLILFTISLFAYVDGDMDGVEDEYDLCLTTPFTDLVGLDGCSIESLVSSHHFSIIAGVAYSDSDYNTLSKIDTITSSFQVDYYYKNFSLSLATSYFSNKNQTYSDSGLNDTYFGGAYQWMYKDLYVSLGVGVLLPTYDTTLNNNNTDYTANINFSYALGDVSLFGTYGYTLVNDDDVEGVVAYQDSIYYSAGVGYYFNNEFYASSYYNEADSLYKNVEKLQTVSLYAYYSLDENYFLTGSYAYGLSDSASDNFVSVKIGYYY